MAIGPQAGMQRAKRMSASCHRRYISSFTSLPTSSAGSLQAHHRPRNQRYDAPTQFSQSVHHVSPLSQMRRKCIDITWDENVCLLANLLMPPEYQTSQTGEARAEAGNTKQSRNAQTEFLTTARSPEWRGSALARPTSVAAEAAE